MEQVKTEKFVDQEVVESASSIGDKIIKKYAQVVKLHIKC